MNPLLIIIVTSLVVIIGYILSRPFENPPKYTFDAPVKDDLQEQYDALIREIKRLQDEAETSDDVDSLKDRIDAKKRKAADLLRQLNPDLDEEISS